MKNGFAQAMAWLHTWGGLLMGWLLFVVCVSGTISCFDGELDDSTVDRMKRHIAECRGCFDRSDFERRFLAAVQAVRDGGLCPGALRDRILAALRAEGWQG